MQQRVQGLTEEEADMLCCSQEFPLVSGAAALQKAASAFVFPSCLYGDSILQLHFSLAFPCFCLHFRVLIKFILPVSPSLITAVAERCPRCSLSLCTVTSPLKAVFLLSACPSQIWKWAVFNKAHTEDSACRVQSNADTTPPLHRVPAGQRQQRL